MSEGVVPAMRNVRESVAVLAVGVLACAVGGQTADSQFTIWRFDNIDSIGGHATHVLGHPHLIDSPYGKAVAFNGVDDALFVDTHPLAGASEYTWEVIFRPDADGAEAQRFFHLSEIDPATGKDTQNRMLFEIRIVKGQWCLDSFAFSNGSARTLLNCDDLHPLRAVVSRDGGVRRQNAAQLRGQRDAGRRRVAFDAAGTGTLVHRNAH